MRPTPTWVSIALLLLLAGGSACDLIIQQPPDDVDPPPEEPLHPYGAGNGKVLFFSDLVEAGQIQVTLGGAVIGVVTPSAECVAGDTTGYGRAPAIRPQGTYQVLATSTAGIRWDGAIAIREDELARIDLYGNPGHYVNHAPTQLAGLPVYGPSLETFYTTFGGSGAASVIISRPSVVQGDRFDVVLNGELVADDVVQAASDVVIPVTLRPGPNWVAANLSLDAGGVGTTSTVYLNPGADSGTGYVSVGAMNGFQWRGFNFRYEC